jgi:hypothetical protein
MPQLDVVYNLDISFNVDSSWMSWTMDIEIVLENWPNPILVGHVTSSIAKVISSSFYAYVERQNPILYVSCRSI